MNLQFPIIHCLIQGGWRVQNSGRVLHVPLLQKVVGHYVIKPPKVGGVRVPPILRHPRAYLDVASIPISLE